MDPQGFSQGENFALLKQEVEAFVGAARHPTLVEKGERLFDLHSHSTEWRLEAEYGKLIFEVWNSSRSVARTLEEVAFRDRGCLGLFVRGARGRIATVLEIRDLAESPRVCFGERRAQFRKQFVKILSERFPDWKIERVGTRSDRHNSFSGVYTRGLARRGKVGWAFLGVSPEEHPTNVNNILGFGLVWLGWLREHLDGVSVGGLKLFLPPGRSETVAHRMAYLDSRQASFALHELDPQNGVLREVDIRNFGNVETRLRPRRAEEAILAPHRELLQQLMGGREAEVDVQADPEGNTVLLWVRGVECARIEGRLNPKITYGLPRPRHRLAEGDWETFHRFLEEVLGEIPAPAVKDQGQGPARSGAPPVVCRSELWLEGILAKDPSRIDHLLDPDHVYRQVFSLAGDDRGVLDLLTRTRGGRPAVLELKLHEEVNFVMQGLDYWMRVKWLNERGEFQKAGYFPETDLLSSPPATLAPPILYLISPAFRFHSTTDPVAGFLSPEVEVRKIGIAENWREEVRVLFRRTINGSGKSGNGGGISSPA